jgi:hypothetical protein
MSDRSTDLKVILDGLTMTLRMTIENQAKIEGLRVFCAQRFSSQSGQDVQLVLKEIEELAKLAHHEILIAYEKTSPEVAAFLDVRRPEQIPDS